MILGVPVDGVTILVCGVAIIVIIERSQMVEHHAIQLILSTTL